MDYRSIAYFSMDIAIKEERMLTAAEEKSE
jgi:hypothetical protein